jgi:preprotein translocase subunit SecE
MLLAMVVFLLLLLDQLLTTKVKLQGGCGSSRTEYRYVVWNTRIDLTAHDGDMPLEWIQEDKK